MKTIKTLLIVSFLTMCQFLTAQDYSNRDGDDSEVEIVRDDATRETFIVFHKRQFDHFVEMRDNEGLIAATQELIKQETDAIREVEQQLFESLKRVEDVIRDARVVVNIGKDILTTMDYLQECDSLTLEDPELLIVGLNTKLAIYKRITKLQEYLTVALTSGEVNLMNNKDRLKFISHVRVEVQTIKGCAFSLKCEFGYARKYGLFRYLFPQLYTWERRFERNLQTSQRIIQEFTM